MANAQHTVLIAGIASSALFITLNVMMNLYMKWLFSPRGFEDPWRKGGDFPLPWTMLAVQQLEAYLVLQPLVGAKQGAEKRYGWNMGVNSDNHDTFLVMCQVMAVTSLFCLNVGLNSLSLVRISITLNQTVRAFLPAGVLLLATCLERRTYPSHSYATTVILVLGIGLTCWGSPDFELYGFGLALASTLVAALGASLNGRMLNAGPFSKEGPAGIMRLMMLQSLPACLMFGVIAVVTEGHQLAQLVADPGPWRWYERLCLVSVSSLLALLANLGRCGLVAATSALMETLAGNAKVAALCVIDHHLFGTRLEPYNYVGIAITFTGFSVHVLLQYATKDHSGEPSSKGSSPVSKDDAGGHLRKHTEFDNPADSEEWTQVSESRPPPMMNRARIISCADSGMIAEYAALELGRQQKPQRTLEIDHGDEQLHHMPALPRPRSMTWQAGTDASQTWLSSMSLDFNQVMEAPTWLLGSNEGVGSDEYSSLPSLAAGSATTPSSRSLRAGSHSSAAAGAPGSRSRSYTDPSDWVATQANSRNANMHPMGRNANSHQASLGRFRNVRSEALLASVQEETFHSVASDTSLAALVEEVADPMEETEAAQETLPQLVEDQETESQLSEAELTDPPQELGPLLELGPL